MSDDFAIVENTRKNMMSVHFQIEVVKGVDLALESLPAPNLKIANEPVGPIVDNF